jgi:hypothetical protein
MKHLLLTFAIALVLFSTTEAQVLQRVIVEEHTGAWCGYCPDGALILENLLANEPDAIGVSIHQGDGMQIAASSYIRNFYGPAFPEATFNRAGEPVSRGQWASAAATILAKDPLVSVSFDSVGFNPNTRVLKVRVKASYVRDTTGPMRFNVFILEDEVTGTGANYDQVNYFNNTNGHPMFGQGNPIVGYVHNHVLRECLGSAWGTGGQIPSTVFAGDEFTYMYSYNMPPYIDWTKVKLVAMVQYFGGQLVYQRPILNGDEMPLTMAVSNDVSASSKGLEIWPNPSVSRTNVSFEMSASGQVRVDVMDLMGSRVASLADGFTNSGTHTVTWNGHDDQGNRAPSGVYFIRFDPETGPAQIKSFFYNPQ